MALWAGREECCKQITLVWARSASATPGLPPLTAHVATLPTLLDHLILCRPLLLLPSIFPSIRVFSYESALPNSWLKYWRFIFNISPSNEHPGLISFRMDWLDLQGGEEGN